jgi:hypothetical protein
MDEQASALITLLQEEQARLLDLIRRQADRIEILETNLPDPLAAEVEQEDHPGLAFETCTSFVEEFVRVVYEVPRVEGGRQALWCDRWMDHPGVVFTLEALWRSYEEARLHDHEDGGGQHLLAWSEGYFYPAMARITDHAGPFRVCESTHQPPTKLGSSEPFHLAPWAEAS